MKYAILRKGVYYCGGINCWTPNIQHALHYTDKELGEVAHVIRIDIGLSGCEIVEVPEE